MLKTPLFYHPTVWLLERRFKFLRILNTVASYGLSSGDISLDLIDFALFAVKIHFLKKNSSEIFSRSTWPRINSKTSF